MISINSHVASIKILFVLYFSSFSPFQGKTFKTKTRSRSGCFKSILFSVLFRLLNFYSATAICRRQNAKGNRQGSSYVLYVISSDPHIIKVISITNVIWKMRNDERIASLELGFFFLQKNTLPATRNERYILKYMCFYFAKKEATKILIYKLERSIYYLTIM